jgi:hypothetical protein
MTALLPLLIMVVAVVILSPLARRLPAWIRFLIGLAAGVYLIYDGANASSTRLQVLGVGVGMVILVASVVELWRDRRG